MTLQDVELGQMAFISDGPPAVGSVRAVSQTALTIYVENSGDFVVPIEAVTGAHDGKVMLDRARLDRAFLAAVGHGHDREVADVAG